VPKPAPEPRGTPGGNHIPDWYLKRFLPSTHAPKQDDRPDDTPDKLASFIDDL
jgi:hypothetical protein